MISWNGPKEFGRFGTTPYVSKEGPRMNRTRTNFRVVVAVVTALVGLASGWATGGDEVSLVPAERVGDSSKVSIELKAEGKYLPGLPASETEKGIAAPATPVKALALKVELQLEFSDKVLETAKTGQATRSARRVQRAGTAINGDLRPTSATVRPEVSLLLADLRADRGLVVFSPGGPLTRSELELLQGPGDPLTLASLLPGRAVKVGDEWNLGNDLAKAVSGYDALATNALVAKLESADSGTAKVSIRGDVRGAVLGGEGAMKIAGSFTFDRQAGRIDSLDLSRDEKRKPGRIEAGLDVQSTLKMIRKAAQAPPELADSILSTLSLDLKPERELLLFRPPGDKFSLVHDRDWHLAVETDRVSVLKRLDRGGDLVAQCNLSLGPNLGKGKHQDPKRFRDDIRRALGERFVQFLSEGEVEGAPGGGYRYKVSVQGREGNVGVLWYYYLVASPAGDHLLATFTLGQAQEKTFGDQDLQLIGSLEWSAPKP